MKYKDKILIMALRYAIEESDAFYETWMPIINLES